MPKEILNDYKVVDGNFITGRKYPTIEHVKPLSMGGKHSWNNVRCACFQCNSAKGDANLMFEEEKELKKLNSIVKQMDEPRKFLTEGLIDNAAFMIHQLSLLQASIREHGVVDEYQNGANQSGCKQSVEMSTYLQLQKSYSVTIRTLEGMLPKGVKEQSEDEMLEFLRNR